MFDEKVKLSMFEDENGEVIVDGIILEKELEKVNEKEKYI